MEWIKVSDRLPPDGEAVMVTMLVAGKKQILANVRRQNNMWQVYASPISTLWIYIKGRYITHWTPMPPPAED